MIPFVSLLDENSLRTALDRLQVQLEKNNHSIPIHSPSALLDCSRVKAKQLFIPRPTRALLPVEIRKHVNLPCDISHAETLGPKGNYDDPTISSS